MPIHDPEVIVSDFIEWRGLRLERQSGYPNERYAHIAEGGAWWLVERIDPSQGWIAWLIAGDRVRILNPGKSATAALDATYAQMKLHEQLHGALLEVGQLPSK